MPLYNPNHTFQFTELDGSVNATTGGVSGGWTDFTCTGAPSGSMVMIVVSNGGGLNLPGIRIKGSALNRTINTGTICITLLCQCDTSSKIQINDGTAAQKYSLLGYYS
jgi:hypothetical protein